MMPRNRWSGGRRGFVLVTMAVAAVVIFGVVGLAIDLGRVFIIKNETQVFCDAAAVGAASALDGTLTGINNAKSAVSSSTNAWNFGTTRVSSPVVKFAVLKTGPWVAAPITGSGYIYVSVAATVAVPLYFLPLATGQSTMNVISSATAGQIPITSLSRGVAPYTAVSTNGTGPKFGLVVGSSYDIQWPAYNDTRAGCGVNNPDKCFISSPCDGDIKASRSAVVANWGAKYSGYWGSTSNSDLAAEVMDVIQLAPVAVGTNIYPLLTSGNKASEASYLDQRASEDTNTSDNTSAGYLASANHNGRRLLPVTIVNPIDPSHTNVIGFGQFLLGANGPSSDYYVKTTNGNDGFCAIYVGPYNIGSVGPGTGGTTGASVTRLVE
jgi:hypothetical protein